MKVLSEELSERQKEFDQYYAQVESEVKTLLDAEEDYQIVRFEHIGALVAQEDVEMKVNEICTILSLGILLLEKLKSNRILQEMHSQKYGH